MQGTAKLGSVLVGGGCPVRIMAAVNVSPESFYKGSVAGTDGLLRERAEKAESEGADMLDLGGMATAPYLKNEVSAGLELSRIVGAMKAVSFSSLPVSVDTMRASVADAALRLGATIVNDVSGLKGDPGMARVVRERGASLLAMANSPGGSSLRPVSRVKAALKETLTIAEKAGLEPKKLALDPGIGFFREEGAGMAYSPQSLMPWYEWDLEVIAGLKALKVLGRPLSVGVSRKSFIGEILGLEDPGMRLSGSIAATAIAVGNGADMVRTHDVKESREAVRVAEALSKRRRLRNR